MSGAQYRIAYTVRRSDRARHARIVVDASGVEVVIPRRMALRHVEPFVEEKGAWIERTLRRIRAAEASAGIRLEDGGSVPYLGEELELWVDVEPGRTRPHVARRGDVHFRIGKLVQGNSQAGLVRVGHKQLRFTATTMTAIVPQAPRKEERHPSLQAAGRKEKKGGVGGDAV